MYSTYGATVAFNCFIKFCWKLIFTLLRLTKYIILFSFDGWLYRKKPAP